MIYPYAVKKNGIYYKAGQNVPEKGVLRPAAPAPKPEQAAVDTDSAPTPGAPLTKSAIKSMTAAQARKAAAELGAEGAGSMTGVELKIWLTNKLGLE